MDPKRPRRRLRRTASPTRQGPVILLLVLTLLIAHALRDRQPGALARPDEDEASAIGELMLHVRRLLPPGSEITRSLLLADGSAALAWTTDGVSRTGVALARPGGGHRLWIAETPDGADLAATASIALMELHDLPVPVLVSTYSTPQCCSWVNLFALESPPRLLFASPTSSARLLAGHVVVKRLLVGEYPGESPANTEIYAWDGQAFALGGATLAAPYYFPLASRMRWSYRSEGYVIDRWVHTSRTVGGQTEYLVRSVARRGGALTNLENTLYHYAPDGAVLEESPFPRMLLGPSPGEGSAWRESKSTTAKVVAIAPWITVPAGTFHAVLVVESGDARFYYAPNTGLIREERGGQVVLELLSVTLP